jgi:hypothetical protein
MTDRIHALTVVLDRDIRDDEDLEPVITAIRMVKGVADVTDKHVTAPDDHMARARLRSELGSTMLDVFTAFTEGRKITIEPRKNGGQ